MESTAFEKLCEVTQKPKNPKKVQKIDPIKKREK